MNIAIYIRLSLEDGDLNAKGKAESESITNQRKMLTDYIRSSTEFCDADILEYCDDGYSGKNFNRPGFESLVAAAKAGIIQCIIVKDISRFGRDYITVGNYITKVFPFLGVRFIAVNDHFDSSRKGDIDSLDTSFKTLIYDMYSRDLSAKVISAKNNLAKRGVYINSVAPYGYRRNPEDKHNLLPDPKTAPTVKRIFTLVADGMSILDVTRHLNVEGVPTPSAAKVGTSSEHASWREDCIWRPQAVYGIVRDRQYIGSTVFGKRRRTQIGVHLQPTSPLDTWIIVDDRHEPIVSKELYNKAQEQLGEYTQDPKHNLRDLPLRKKVYCGVCRRVILRSQGKNPYYRCQRPNYAPNAQCSQDKIFESELLEIVRETIRVQVRCAVELKRIMDIQHKKETAQASTLKAELGRLKGLQEQITMQNQTLYENFVDGKLSRDAYAAQKADLIQKREDAYTKEAKIKARLAAATEKANPVIQKYCSYADLDTLTDKSAIELLERITIFPDGLIDIKLAYADELAELAEAFHLDILKGA